jgi:hypothetical protein
MKKLKQEQYERNIKDLITIIFWISITVTWSLNVVMQYMNIKTLFVVANAITAIISATKGLIFIYDERINAQNLNM